MTNSKILSIAQLTAVWRLLTSLGASPKAFKSFCCYAAAPNPDKVDWTFTGFDATQFTLTSGFRIERSDDWPQFVLDSVDFVNRKLGELKSDWASDTTRQYVDPEAFELLVDFENHLLMHWLAGTELDKAYATITGMVVYVYPPALPAADDSLPTFKWGSGNSTKDEPLETLPLPDLPSVEVIKAVVEPTAELCSTPPVEPASNANTPGYYKNMVPYPVKELMRYAIFSSAGVYAFFVGWMLTACFIWGGEPPIYGQAGLVTMICGGALWYIFSRKWVRIQSTYTKELLAQRP